MLVTALAIIPLLIWIYLLGFRGSFWRISKHLAVVGTPRAAGERVAVVIPARDEANVIGATIMSLLKQDLPTPLHIFLVDDGSTDHTAQIAMSTAERAGRSDCVTVITGQPLVEGWTGKLWALSQGISQAQTLAPDFLLLTDADVVHGRESVATLVAIADSKGCDLTSFMVKLACKSFAEKVLIPAFIFFFLKFYPPRWVGSQSFRTAAAAGGCILIRPEALQKIGGLATIRSEVIDDCALARQTEAQWRPDLDGTYIHNRKHTIIWHVSRDRADDRAHGFQSAPALFFAACRDGSRIDFYVFASAVAAYDR